ncbi:response regulator transcription factor [Chromatiaceae bacterium AAb-1]|nr:response regulator transcription factor [Chromatiaceae bacterium AAb-1]
MNRIILVEDHERLTALLSTALHRVGIECDCFSSSASAWQAFSMQQYAVLVLDRGLPDGEGLALLRRLRSNGNMIPCLVLTARNAVHDRIEGLESGADDYLSKPFAMDELVARVRALLRRPPVIQTLNPKYGDLELYPATAQLECAAKQVMLAPAEVQIMFSLMQSAGEMVARNKLEQAAWGLSEAVTPNALDVALHRLRKKLLELDSTITITNIRGRGYALH